MKLRIDFRIQEVTEDENPRGISFGDVVEVSGMLDFFDRCRDAAKTLFIGNKPKDTETSLREELEKIKQQRALEHALETRKGGVASLKSQQWAKTNERQWDGSDDGSRGGDGPADPEWIARQAAKTIGYPRY